MSTMNTTGKGICPNSLPCPRLTILPTDLMTFALVYISAIPRAEVEIASVTMKAGALYRVMITAAALYSAILSNMPAPTARTPAIKGRDPGSLGQVLIGAQHHAAYERDHRACGKVGVSGDDQQRDTAGDDGNHSRFASGG